MVKIIVSDSVWCQIVEGKEFLFPILSYQSETHKKVQYGTKRIVKRKFLISELKKGDFFYTGFLYRVQKYCKENNIPLKIEDPHGTMEPLFPENEPHVEGKYIRKGKWSYQYDLISKAIISQRGIIKAATGSGKTTMMLGIISCYPSLSTLFLCNTHTPITQFKKTLALSGLNQPIDIFTIQSFYRKKPKEYKDKYGMILIDEVHDGLRTFNSMYAKVLKNSCALIRLGFTATLPDDPVARLAMEGLLGPVIGELTIQEGIDMEVLSKPKIIIKKLPDNPELKNSKSYRDVYINGVVKNRAMTRQIILDSIKDSQSGPVLILVTEIEHGEEIVNMAKRIFKREIVFAQGKTDKDLREDIRQGMISGDIDIVIGTAVFKKALDVPNLVSVILGFGGKSDAQTMQAIGRGTRNIDGNKRQVIIRDYFCPSHYHLIKHFGFRLCFFIDEGWI
uniref:Putative type III restriction enzyme n=1 Tax=viral metagenome TaxID=1070528 RepID=A0A6M3KGU0_9ZZZZ